MSDPRPTFDALVDKEYAVAIAIALGLLRDRELATDVAQEAMLRAFRQWEQLQTFDRPGAWVRRVVLNLCDDQLRSRRRAALLVRRVGDNGRASSGADQSVVPDLGLWEAVAELPARLRRVIILHYTVGLPVDEVAAQLGRPVGTVKSDLSRARKRLRQRIERDLQ